MRRNRKSKKITNVHVMEKKHNPFLSTPELPPEYFANTVVSRVFRFKYAFTSSPQTYNISASKLCALQVIGTTTNTSATQLFEAVKVRKIEVWGGPLATGNAFEAAVTFSGNALGVTGPNRTYSASSVGMTRPAYVCAKPGKETQAAQWQSGDTNVGTNTLFTLNFAAVGASPTTTVTIDVHLVLRVTHNTRTSNNTVTLTTVALTSMYYLALDNAAGGTLSSASDLAPDRNLVTTQ